MQHMEMKLNQQKHWSLLTRVQVLNYPAVIHLHILFTGTRQYHGRRHIRLFSKNVSGYVCNHGSPSGERDTASPRGRYGERPQRDSV